MQVYRPKRQQSTGKVAEMACCRAYRRPFRGRPKLMERDGSVRTKGPARVMRYFPRVPVKVEKHPGVATPKRALGFPPKGPPRRSRFFDHLIDSGGRRHIVSQGDAAPATAVDDGGVAGE